MDLLEKLRAFAMDRSQEGRLRLLMAVLGALLVGGAVLTLLCALWATGKGQVQGAIVSGVFTLVAAMGGAFIVLYQLRTQARNTLIANAHGEALKLKKSLYDDVLKGCKAVTAGANAVNGFAKSFRSAVSLGSATGHSIPHHKIEDLGPMNAELFSALNDLVRMARSWTITVPRMSHYQEVFEEASREVHLAVVDFYGASFRHFADRSEKPAHWKAPDGKQMAQLEAVTDRLDDFIDKLMETVGGFESEMQTALLGELFNRR